MGENSQMSVIICTFGRPESLNNCLESLVEQTLNPADFEVIIVCPDSDQKSKEVARLYANRLNLGIFSDPEKGLAAARDLGWKQAKSEIIAWIDDDIVVCKNWAESIVKTLDNNPDIAGVSGPTIVDEKLLKNRDVFFFYGKKGLAGLLGKFWNYFFLEGKMYEPGKLLKSGAWSPGANFPPCLNIQGLKEVDYLEACNMALRKDLVEKANGFDPGFQGTAEWCEIDLAQKVKKLGHKLVFNPKAVVYHHISQSGAFTKRTKAKERMENFFRFYFRHVFKPSPNYIFKFLSYLLFLNFYWIYKAITAKNINWLSGLAGTASGFLKLTQKAKE